MSEEQEKQQEDSEAFYTEGETEDIIKEYDSSLFPEDHKYFTFLKKVFRHELRKSSFRRISTPLLTKKELYTASDQEHYNQYSVDEEHSLKFDPTLSALDLYLRYEQNLELQPVYYYYIDQIFLQKEGNLKETHVIGGEIIGEKEPILDMECIFLLDRIFKVIGLEGQYSIVVNSVGLKKEQGKYIEALQDFYSDKKHLLSDVSLEHLENDPFQLLNPQTEDEKILLEQAPIMRKFLKKHSKLHLEKFEEFMEMVGIEYTYDNHFLLPNKYYTNTIWKIVENQTGKCLASGGRYDTLSLDISDLKKEIPATGFSARVARIITLLKNNRVAIRNKDQLDLYFVQLGDEAKKAVFPVTTQARKAGINTLASLGTPSMKEQILKAQRSGAHFVVIVGIMEARNGLWQLRNLKKGTQIEIKKEDIIDYVINEIGKENLDFYSPMNDVIITEVIEEVAEDSSEKSE